MNAVPRIPRAESRFLQEVEDLRLVLQVCERWGYMNVLDVITTVTMRAQTESTHYSPCHPAVGGDEEE